MSGRIFVGLGHGWSDYGAPIGGDPPTEAGWLTRYYDDALLYLARARIVVPVPRIPIKSVESDGTKHYPRTTWLRETLAPEDVVIDVHGNAAAAAANGCECYVAEAASDTTKAMAAKLLACWSIACPGVRNRGVKSERLSAAGKLAICSSLPCPGLVFEPGYLTSALDRDRMERFGGHALVACLTLFASRFEAA